MVWFTFSRTAVINDSFSGAESKRYIISTTSPIISSFTPRVVMAGVTTRVPDVWNGERLGKGNMFLFTVIAG